MNREVILTHAGLSRIRFDQDFELRTDSPVDTIKCSRSQISFISPVVSKLLLSDPTIDKFTLKTVNSCKCSSLLRSLLNGSSITITNDFVSTFRSISAELGNDEIFCCIQDDLTLENAIEAMQIKQMKSLGTEKEIEFISSHFCDFESEDIASLDISTIDSILGSKPLVVESEHSLFEFIRCLISSRGDEFRFLLSHLHLEYLEKEDISIFIDFVDENNIGSFLPCIYRSLLISQPSKILEEDKKRYIQHIFYKDNKFDGIFSYLWKCVGGNPVTSGIVDIEAIGDLNKSNSDISYLIDSEKRMQENWFFGVTNEGGSFVFDFKEKVISLNGYSLKAASSYGNNINFMNSWKIEGSNDKRSWSIIDNKKSDILQTNMAEGYFPCIKTTPFRYLRIMLTEKTTNNNFCFYLQAIEFFGFISK